jgi:hypothetical protein
VSLEKRRQKQAGPSKKPAHTRGPHLHPPPEATVEQRIRIADVLQKFIVSTGLDPRRTPVSGREFKLYLLLVQLAYGLTCQAKPDRGYDVLTDTELWERWEVPAPKRGRPSLVPALVIAIRELVDFIGATNAAHIVLVTHYRDWSELPVVLGTDGKALIRRLAQRLSKIAAGQWSESDGRRLPQSEVVHRSVPHWRLRENS